MNLRTPLRTALSASCIVASALTSQVSLGSRAPHVSFPIIYLSSIANDTCRELDPKLTWEVNALATMQLADKAVRKGVRRFIYASSGSVYGVKEEAQVTEDLELRPISEYNKTKMVAERVLLSYANELAVQIIRPATVCGYSPRMRLDVSVNLLTMQALTKEHITLF